MSPDLEKAARLVDDGAAFAAVKGEDKIVSHTSGVSFLYSLAAERGSLSGYCAADKIVGAAAAYLMARAGVSEVYARVLSVKAAGVLSRYAIPADGLISAESIVNRSGAGECPMEEAVSGVCDADRAYAAIGERLKRQTK